MQKCEGKTTKTTVPLDDQSPRGQAEGHDAVTAKVSQGVVQVSHQRGH